ncbi:nitroreductase family protein [Robiginitalea aurantiaca]|uniref:Nitroreductase family protein n=1 Tax=Robiginitalea aurantiaca TaxID=3056915 RepID=A0ABT7WFN8_9FLAO|nr:nitroreductase family protein [Robiginitalea aurantiaca]MDM9631629.1 nitroreductase family protein [Robiginitalea aurantiaca]
MEKTVTEAIAYRRAVRVFEDIPIDQEHVRNCIRNGALAPTSSNLQLWEFIHVTKPDTLKAISKCCFDQNAAKTARQIVVVVARRDLWRKRARANTQFLQTQFENNTDPQRWKRRRKMAMNYYGKLIPTLYTEFLGFLGLIRFLFFWVVGLFRPIYRQVRKSDLRIVAHKSAALAAENFMISMAAIGYDTCPMEGFDSLRVKKVLGLPASAEINMIIGCGIRNEKGIYGPRFRIPFEEVYTQI